MFAALPILAVITSAADLKRAVWNEPGTSETFAFTGTVTSVTGSNLSYWIMDETGVCYVRRDMSASTATSGSAPFSILRRWWDETRYRSRSG